MGNNKIQTRLTHEEEYSYSRRLKEMSTLNNSNKAAAAKRYVVPYVHSDEARTRTVNSNPKVCWLDDSGDPGACLYNEGDPNDITPRQDGKVGKKATKDRNVSFPVTLPLQMVVSRGRGKESQI
jgi:hypothetical protein